ncbi:hypothetical protein B5S28_g3703 [[Candida] boidinii]|nr:hypothetical protein B5S28_g3703 [[Candida] boidinii]
MSSSEDDDKPIASLGNRRKRQIKHESESEDDIPLGSLGNSKSTTAKRESSTRKRAKTLNYNESDDDDDDNDDDEDDYDDQPISKAKKSSTTSKTKPKTKPKTTAKVKKETTSTKSKKTTTTVTKVKKEPAAKVKRETNGNSKATATKTNGSTTKKTTTSKVKKEVKKEETPELSGSQQPEDDEEEDDKFKWWEQQDLDGEVKWESLEHNGVVFPPEYEPLPKDIKLIYDGKPVQLPPDAEEVAGFFAAMLESEHAKNPVFQKNFFKDFLEVLKESGGCKDGTKIEKFENCNFRKMWEYFEMKREEKKSLPPQEKKRIKKEKEEAEEEYKYCYLNGRKEQVGNFRIEPPGLFRGRGAHPKTGKLKRRVKPEDVVLNLGKDAKIPEPPKGHNWGEVKHDNTVAWLAMWRENISNSVKYVRFSQNSSLKGISDFKKFEKARELKNYIDIIRKDYREKLKSEFMVERQIATATYLIDVFALRAGGEKSDDEADTVGCCSLRYEHVFLKPPSTVIFDFLGKDSIRYHQEVEVDKQVFKNLRIFKKAPKKPGDDLFDRLDPSILNKYFQNYLQGLTAKVFRTYNASKTMQDQLDLIPNEGTINEKVVRFNAANRAVAILCNHQRTVSKNHDTSVQKINEKIQEMVWQKIRIKRMILQLDKKLLKKEAKYFEEIDDLTKEDEAAIHIRIIEREKEKAIKKFEKDNEKLKYEGEKQLTQSELKEKLKKVSEYEKELKKELKSKKPELKSNITVEKLKSQVEKLETRITNTTLSLKDKEDNSTVALGTSKMNYIDPRLTVMFAKRYDVPIEKLFTKTLREKFAWAIESVDKEWRF